MSPTKRILLMLVLTCMWSPSFLFIKYALDDLPPLTIASSRVTIAGLLICGLLVWKRTPLPTNIHFWARAWIMALFACALPFFLFCFAEQSIDSAVAAILNGTTPMFTAVLAHLFVLSDRLSFQKVIGILFSTLGILMLFYPQLSSEDLSATTLGMAAAVTASFCYAISHVYGKLNVTGYQPFVVPAAQLIMSALILWPLAFWNDNVLELAWPSNTSIAGVMGLAMFGTVFAFILYYHLLDYCGPTAISMVACFFPVGGMFLGFIFLEESFTSWSLMSSGVIFLGMLIVNNIIKLPFRTKLVVSQVSSE